MSRKSLHIVKTVPKPRVTFSLLRKAIRLYKHAGVTKAVYRANARKWLRSMLMLGERHILKGARVTWGTPGDGRRVEQIHAPRVSGDRT